MLLFACLFVFVCDINVIFPDKKSQQKYERTNERETADNEIDVI
jgi:hypothetical protein